MGKGDIFRYRKTMSPEDQRTHDRWLRRNAVIGLILTLGLIAMAVAGSNSSRAPATANNNNPDVIASEQHSQ